MMNNESYSWEESNQDLYEMFKRGEKYFWSKPHRKKLRTRWRGNNPKPPTPLPGTDDKEKE
jgi:hypothetical protein